MPAARMSRPIYRLHYSELCRYSLEAAADSACSATEADYSSVEHGWYFSSDNWTFGLVTLHVALFHYLSSFI